MSLGNGTDGLPDVPEESSQKIRAILKMYRKTAHASEVRASRAEKQQKFLAGQLVQLKEQEALTYARLLEALQLLGEYRLLHRSKVDSATETT